MYDPTDYTLLVVEDDPDIQELLVLHLTDDGYRVVTADTGTAALAQVRQHRDALDAILLDLMLPGVGGLTVLDVVRDDPATAALPVILLTALSDTARKVEAMQLGATDYVTKPFDVREISVRIEKVLRKRAPRAPREEALGSIE